MGLILFQYFWIFIVFVIAANGVVWRIAARDRINADPLLRKPLNRLYGGFVFWLSLPFLMMGLSIISGGVDNVLDYLTADIGNPHILGLYALIFAEDALFIYWVFFRRGDHFLALHTELPLARPKFRFAARMLAVALPLMHGMVLYYVTFSPHFGQFFGAHGA